MSLIWSRTDGPNGPSVSVVFSDGDVRIIGKENPSLALITQKLALGALEEEILALVNPAPIIIERFKNLSDRITTNGSNLFLDGDIMNGGLSSHILNLLRLEAEGKESVSWQPFVNFLEKLSQNPSQKSQDSLYSFIEKHGLTILPDGDFIAYKGVQGDFGSINRGPGIVDGRKMEGSLPNKAGSTLWVERAYVNDDTNNACGQGLHAGTVAYATWWSTSVGKVVAVSINPRDVVSVPDAENAQKIRVCKYTVLHEVPKGEVKSQATVGRSSTPLYKLPKNYGPGSSREVRAIDEEIRVKLQDAIANGDTLEVEYDSWNTGVKTYTIKPVKIKDSLLKNFIVGSDTPRSFRIDRIKSVKVISSTKRSEKAEEKVDTLSKDLVKTLNKALKKGRALVIDYVGDGGVSRQFHITPRAIVNAAKPLLKIVEDHRTFRIDRIKSVQKLKDFLKDGAKPTSGSGNVRVDGDDS